MLPPTHVGFLLVAGHFVADYPLQGDTVALQKNPLTDNALSRAVPFYYWMTAHALTHGAIVLLLTGSVRLGVAETFAHWVIDYTKCRRWIDIHTDQTLHLVCKALWLALYLA